jgi:signal transduction histidine kinase
MTSLVLLVGVAAAALSAVLLALLLVQGRALRAARVALRQRQAELEHAVRLAAVGELSASIAHEINQPLGAILSNADAAELLLARPQVPLEDLRSILVDIRADDLRAHAVIRRLRALLERRETERRDVDVHALLAGRDEGDRRRGEPPPHPTPARARREPSDRAGRPGAAAAGRAEPPAQRDGCDATTRPRRCARRGSRRATAPAASRSR